MVKFLTDGLTERFEKCRLKANVVRLMVIEVDLVKNHFRKNYLNHTNV